MKIAKLLSGVALIGFVATSAQAADLLYSQPAPQAAVAYGGPYVAVRAGVNWADDVDGDFDADADVADTLDFDTGFNASVAAGYAFGGRWGILSPRLEAELGYLTNDAEDSAVDAGVAVATDGEYNATYGLVNLLLDIPMGWGFTPFVGVGAGFANVRFDNIAATAGAIDTFDGEDTTFAWNLTAGLSYDITRNVTLELAYRFLQFTDAEILNTTAGVVTDVGDLDNHQVNFGVRVHL